MPTETEKLEALKAAIETELDRLFDKMLDELPDQIAEVIQKDGIEGLRRLLHVTVFDMQNALIERAREIDPAMGEDMAKISSGGRA